MQTTPVALKDSLPVPLSSCGTSFSIGSVPKPVRKGHSHSIVPGGLLVTS